MDLEQLQDLAEKDLKINDTELDLESLKTPQQVYAERPFNLKILKTDIDKYMESDDELVKLKSKVEYIQTVIDFLDSTIKQISNRGFQIKNAIDWRKFTSGAI
jgi:hypothetical protein